MDAALRLLSVFISMMLGLLWTSAKYFSSLSLGSSDQSIFSWKKHPHWSKVIGNSETVILPTTHKHATVTNLFRIFEGNQTDQIRLDS